MHKKKANTHGKEKPTDEQKAKAATLKKLSDDRATELSQLQTKKETELTPADKKRVADLVQMKKLVDQTIPDIERAMEGTQRARTTSFRQQQSSELRKIVATVAKAKGYKHVFDSDAMAYSVNDVTQDVIQKLPKP